jgi:hypothetical protein
VRVDPPIRVGAARADQRIALANESNPSADAPSRFLALGAGACFALTALTSLAGLGGAALASPKPAWTLFGFEFVVAVSALLGLFFAKGGCRVAPAMGLACLGGTIGAASVLGFFSVQGTLSGVSLLPFLAVRGLIAAALGGLALIAAMQGDRRSWATLIKGVLAGMPALIGIALFILPAGKPVLSAVFGLGGFASFLIGTLGFLLLTASASAAVHLVIQSFQTASQGRSGQGRTPA